MQKTKTRTVLDSMGSVEVPARALYGAQTQRAINNFPISGLRMPRHFIGALGHTKAACAKANHDLGLLDDICSEAIAQAATEVANGIHDEQFPIDIFQTGSGTSTNMNANEVIAHLASQSSGKDVHPNDHVNKSQSSNDVIPSCIHISAALLLYEQLLPALQHLTETLDVQACENADLVKTGRTHLMDAMPLTVAQELGGWASQIRQHHRRIALAAEEMRALAIGGTAVGTGINAHPEFGQRVAHYLTQQTQIAFQQATNTFQALSSQDATVSLSGQLKALATSLMKISNDLRWMNSGPLAGLGEIQLPALQPGSSIMPGKVNPVIPEAVTMICAQVIGNDATITVAGQSGNFQLNVMLPVIAYNLLQSIEILANGSRLLADLCIAEMIFNREHIAQRLTRNPILVTALNAVIGYEKGAEIAKRAYRENRPLIDIAAEMTDLSREKLEELLDPHRLTHNTS